MKAAYSPPRPVSGKLFVFGATIGPLVDSLHNQCLLEYTLAPISVPWPEALSSLKNVFEQEYLLCSSWYVPVLLGCAYAVLGDTLPRVCQWILDATITRQPHSNSAGTPSQLRTKAILAVATTAMIIKLSQYLELHQPFKTTISTLQLVQASSQANYTVLLLAAVLQWLLLDGTFAALLAAAITSIGGPLSELPFVANHFWEYIPSAADYFPVQNVLDTFGVFTAFLGDNYRDLGLSSITGPCYFAVTMDAIALGRWFQSSRQGDRRQ